MAGHSLPRLYVARRHLQTLCRSMQRELTAAFTAILKGVSGRQSSVARRCSDLGRIARKIEHGDRVDLLASADMEQPRTLARPAERSS